MRADPNASVESARRHFFRHFHDIKELKRNPIAAPFFEAARAQKRPAPEHAALLSIHSAVQKILADYERSISSARAEEPFHRQLALFKAYVFEQRDPVELARELGLSDRQFYRDYSRVRDRILQSLAPSRPAAITSEWLKSEEAPIIEAELLLEGNRVEEAVRSLRMAIGAGSDSALRAKMLCRLAYLHIDQAQYADAEAALRDASRMGTAEAGAVSLATDLLDWQSLEKRTNRLGSGYAPPRWFEALGADRESAETHIEWLLSKADRLTFLGEFFEAAAVLERARIILDSRRDLSVRQRVMFLRHRAVLSVCTSPQKMSQAAQALKEAVTLAKANRLLRSAAYASQTLAVFQVLSGETSRGLDILSECETIYRRSGDRIKLAEVLLDVVEAERELDPDNPIVDDSLQRARTLLPPDDYRLAPVYAHLTMAAVDAHDYEKALEYGKTAQRGAVAVGSTRLQGAVLREMARSYYHLGDAIKAKESILQAMALMREHGAKLSFARAREIYDEITGGTPPAARSA